MKKNKNLTMQVYEKIIDLMLRHQIVPGQRLVFIDLANMLNVSRTPVNNALSILAREGYLDFVPNQGYSVHRLDRKEAGDLFEMREVLEVGFAEKLLTNMTDERIDEIESCKDAYENVIYSPVHRSLFLLDMKFHLAILDLAHNDILLSRYRNICQKIFMQIRTEEVLLERTRENIQEHNQLFEALRVRDAEATVEMLKVHTRKSQKALFDCMFQQSREL